MRENQKRLIIILVVVIIGIFLFSLYGNNVSEKLEKLEKLRFKDFKQEINFPDVNISEIKDKTLELKEIIETEINEVKK